MKEYKNIDDLLETSLLCDKLPSEDLNESLKFKIENKAKENKGISIWWLPMVVSIAIGMFTFIGVRMFVSRLLIQNILLTLCFIGVFFNIIMTLIGLKYFELKKGAKIII